MTFSKSKLEVIAPANDPVIITHRFIKASPALLFKVWTTPEHLKQWLGPKDLEARDGHLSGGMERGMSEGYERLDALVENLSKGGAA